MPELNPETHLQIDMLGGNCPVQAEGRYGDIELYFRAHGNRWSVELTKPGETEAFWIHEEPYGSLPFEAGWMEESEAMTFIAKAISIYEAGLSDGAEP